MIQTRIGVQQYPPGDFAIWIFIYAELLVFGIFILVYYLGIS